MIAMLASNSINLLPDTTIVPQLIVYLTVLFVLNSYVIQPTLLVLKRRRELTTLSEAQSAEKQAKIEELHVNIENTLKTERQKILLAEEGKQKIIEAEIRERLENTRKQSQNFIEAERSELNNEAARVAAELAAGIPAMQQEILERVTRFEEVAS